MTVRPLAEYVAREGGKPHWVARCPEESCGLEAALCGVNVSGYVFYCTHCRRYFLAEPPEGV